MKKEVISVEEQNKLGNIEFTQQGNNPVVKSETSIFAESFYFKKVYDEQEFKKFILNTERLIRGSREYTGYVELLRTNLSQLNADNILSNITSADAELEFHHYPLSLYDIVEIVSVHSFLSGKDFNTFTLSKEIMESHYANTIGLVPLSKTNHELAHNGDLFISKKQIFGDYKKFIVKYKKGIAPDLIERIKKMEELSDKNIPSDLRRLY
jgi:hypothetical protein